MTLLTFNKNKCGISSKLLMWHGRLVMGGGVYVCDMKKKQL